MNISKNKLTKIYEFNSGPDPSGTDYYDVYEINGMANHLIINHYGVAYGWEIDTWEIIEFKNSEMSDFKKVLLENDHKNKILAKSQFVSSRIYLTD